MKTIKHEVKLERSVKIILGAFAFGIILNVSQSYSTEKEINSFEEFTFNDQTYFVYDSIEESFPEKNVIKLPISNQNTTKFTS